MWVILLFQPTNKLLPLTPIFSNKHETFMPFGLDCLVGEKYSHTLMPFGYRGHDTLHSRLLTAFNCQSSNQQRFCKCITSHYATQRQTGCLTPSVRALHWGTARVASIFGAFHFMDCCKTSSDNLMVPSK